MRNIPIKEITDKKNITVYSPELSVMDLIHVAGLHPDCSLFYFTDSSGKYLGAVNKRKLLEYIGTYALFIDSKNTNNFTSKLKTIPVTEIINPRIPLIHEEDLLTEAFSQITTQNFNALPVINSEGLIIGEITMDSLLGVLTKTDFKINVSA